MKKLNIISNQTNLSMKKFTKMFVVGLIAASTIFTSCIDNEVAPEVTQLRAAQVAYVEAEARLKAAEAEAQEISNAFAEAMNALTLERERAELDLRLAQIDAELIDAQAALEVARLALEQAIDDLEEYLAEHGLDQAARYLAEYSDAMDEVYDINDEILGQVAYIAGLQIALDNDDFERARQMIQRDLDRDEAELALWQEALVAAEAASEDPSSLSAQIAAAAGEISRLENEIVLAEAEADAYEQVVADAYNAWIMAIGGFSWNSQVFYDDPSEEFADAQEDIIDYNEDIEDYNADIDFWNDQIAETEGYIATQESLLAARTPEAEAFRATADALYEDFLAADADLTVADNNLAAANLTDDQALEDYFDAVAARIDAEDDYFDALADRNAAEQDLVDATADDDANRVTYEANLDAAETTLGTAEDDLDAAQADYDADPTQVNLDALNAARVDYENALDDVAFWEGEIQDLDDALAEATANLPLAEAALTTAIANLNAAESAEQSALDAYLADLDAIDPVFEAYQAALAAYDEADDAYSEADNIADNAEDIVADIENNIEGYNFDLIFYEEQIASIQENLAEAIADLAEAEAELALWADLASLTEVEIAELYATYLTEDNAWDDLYDAIDLLREERDIQETLYFAYENYIGDFNDLIDEILDTIEDLEDSIAGHMEDLANEDIDEQELIDIIANEEGYLAQLQEELASWEALAAEYLALFNAALAG